MCTHNDCHCQSEIGIERDGRRYCSQSCANAAANERRKGAPLVSAGSRRRQENCGCGHVGCSVADELVAGA